MTEDKERIHKKEDQIWTLKFYLLSSLTNKESFKALLKEDVDTQMLNIES